MGTKNIYMVPHEREHTYVHTDRHCDPMTESAQWADSVKIPKPKKLLWETDCRIIYLPYNFFRI